MNLIFPEWIPLWVQFVLLILAVIFGICFLLMPFAVFGLKGRLNYLNQQMEDVQAQLRILLKRTVDLRPRSESKIQIVTNNPSDIENLKNLRNVEKKTNRPENYVYPLPTFKKRFMSSDHLESKSFDSVSSSDEQEIKIQNTDVRLENGRLRQTQPIYVENRRENQLYDPPPPENEKKEVINIKKRTEPILRWPPQ